MRRVGLVATLAMAGVVGVAVAACDQVASMLPAPSMECGGTRPDLCRAVAELGVQQVNRDAVGAITKVTLESGDCRQLAQSTFHHELADATTCWGVTVDGESSHGWGTIGLWPDGSLRAFW